MAFTLTTPCTHLAVIQKSRFLVQAAPITTPAQAQNFIDHISDPSATHNCWAWKLGDRYRFSDDGEPGGTAGRPMLTAIEGQDFDQVVVVITRHFGGIKLGTGGLARAYGGSTAKCLQEGQAMEIVPYTRCRCHCRFTDLALFKVRLSTHQGLLESENFDATGAWLTLAVPRDNMAQLQDSLVTLSRGQSHLEPLSE